ncbi:MAG: hypothetical protein ACI8QZ_000635 [Chlamydiales bacterium]|jgi:hypothetical protein
MRDDIPERLRDIQQLLQALLVQGQAPSAGRKADQRPWEARARRALDRLQRDLLPRTAGAHGHLVVGIVGPNNGGKSALFNSLAGRTLSPSLPRGGATRHLIGVCHPELAASMEREPTLARFPLRRTKPDEDGVLAATEAAGDPAELLLVESLEFSDDLLLIDTPDFDSILVDNRLASESLLKVCDLAIVVVTRHTYQNKEVVAFLEGWLAHERPWLLVYNESITEEVTSEHAAKLAEDLGSDPVGIFHAPFDIEVQRSGAQLSPIALQQGADQISLGEWLRTHSRGEELKARALESSTGELVRDLDSVASALQAECELAQELTAALGERALRLGHDIARRAMPMAPFLDAFRAVLDRRPKLVSGGIRTFVRRSGLFFGEQIARLPWMAGNDQTQNSAATLRSVELAALEPAWSPFFEDLSLEFNTSGPFWIRAGRLDALDPELAEALDHDLAPDACEAARERAHESLDADPEVLRAFQEACETQIESELEQHRNEWIFQFAIDTVHLLPAMAAGIVIFQTGGLGLDIAVGGVGALSTLLAERVSKLLGTQVAKRARERWRELRGGRLAQHLISAALPRSSTQLERRRAEGAQRARKLRALTEALNWSRPS